MRRSSYLAITFDSQGAATASLVDEAGALALVARTAGVVRLIPSRDLPSGRPLSPDHLQETPSCN